MKKVYIVCKAYEIYGEIYDIRNDIEVYSKLELAREKYNECLKDKYSLVDYTEQTLKPYEIEDGIIARARGEMSPDYKGDGLGYDMELTLSCKEVKEEK